MEDLRSIHSITLININPELLETEGATHQLCLILYECFQLEGLSLQDILLC